jgi:hypothetical protein
MKATFKAARLLPKWLLGGWIFAEDFIQSSRGASVVNLAFIPDKQCIEAACEHHGYPPDR